MIYGSQTCFKRPYKTRHVLAFQTGARLLLNESSAESWTGGCLLLNESSAESSCRSFMHYFQSAISNHLSEKPNICHLNGWSLKTGLTVP